MTTDVLLSIHNNTGLITLNRPKALNAITLEMFDAIFYALSEWSHQPNIHQVIISSSCPKAFCAGGDLRYIYENYSDLKKLTHLFEHEYRLTKLIHHYPKPYISLLNGITMGGGVGLGLHGSHRIAANNLTLAMPETKIGFFPDITSSYLLNRCPGKIGLYLALSSRSIPAADAYTLGLIDAIIPTYELARFQADLLKTANTRLEKLIDSFRTPLQPSTLLLHQLKIDHHFSKPTIQSILHSLSLDPDPFCQSLLNDLKKKSPLSLAVTFKQHELTRDLSFNDCNALDLKLAHHFIEDPDFFEGIRAAIIDKRGDPKWNPAKIEDVSEAMVGRYFS